MKGSSDVRSSWARRMANSFGRVITRGAYPSRQHRVRVIDARRSPAAPRSIGELMSGTRFPGKHRRWTPTNPLRRALAIADAPGDDDDTHLRKRVGVIAGVATIIAPLTLPIQAPDNPLSMPFAIALAAYALVNLVVLARTRAFERYVVALIAGLRLAYGRRFRDTKGRAVSWTDDRMLLEAPLAFSPRGDRPGSLWRCVRARSPAPTYPSQRRPTCSRFSSFNRARR